MLCKTADHHEQEIRQFLSLVVHCCQGTDQLGTVLVSDSFSPLVDMVKYPASMFLKQDKHSIPQDYTCSSTHSGVPKFARSQFHAVQTFH